MQRNIELKTLNLRRLDLEQNISLKYIETSQNDNNKPMTTVVAIKSSDGIILASDSQGTNNTIKDLEISKIFRINDSIGVGAAGDIGHIRVLIDKLKEQLEPRKFKTELELRHTIDDIICQLFKKYDVERSERLGFSKTVFLFEPSAIVGAKLDDGTFALYRVRFPPWVDPIEEYDAIGSGDVYAKLLVRQQKRVVPSELSTVDKNYNVWICMLTINEIKTFDAKTGGNTQVVIIDKDGFKQLSRDDTRNLYNEYRDVIATELSKKVGISEERAFALYPEP
jgi:20S proteasome alpha/beta subunit